MKYVYIKHNDENSLTHYGVKGMKWKHHKRLYDVMWDLKHPITNSTEYTSDGKTVSSQSKEVIDRSRGDTRTTTYTRKNGKWKVDSISYKYKKTPTKSNRFKKTASKGASFLSKKFGGYRIKTGKMNTVSANGKKHKRYVSVTKNGRPKAFIPY